MLRYPVHYHRSHQSESCTGTPNSAITPIVTAFIFFIVGIPFFIVAISYGIFFERLLSSIVPFGCGVLVSYSSRGELLIGDCLVVTGLEIE